MDAAAPSVQRIADLQQFIADLSRVNRIMHLANTGRPENDVEHSYSLAVTCWYLAPKIAPDLSLEKIFGLALAHDTVEAYAGDTFVFGDETLLGSKSDREDAAIEQMKREWTDFPQLTDAARVYKDRSTEEAKFVAAVDKILPFIMVNLGEKDAFWTRHRLTLEMQKQARKEKICVSEYVAPYYDRLFDWLTDPDYFYKPE